MIFRFFEVAADRVREQSAEYAATQARIGRRAVAQLVDPFGLAVGLGVEAPEPAPTAGADLQPPRRERAVRRSVRPAGIRASRPRRPRPASNFA